MNPAFPIYIVSKGRWRHRLTVFALQDMAVPFRIIVEEQEFDRYAEVIDPQQILVLPARYLDHYDTCDEWERMKSVGPGAARNFAWDHAVQSGAAWHWVMDDNLDAFHRFNDNKKRESDTGAIFKAAEDFVLRYDNIAQAGFNYYSFVKEGDAVPPFTLNTRIYSCLLIRSDVPYRWRARYNEDTDLSLRVLKDGWCTVLFNAFLCGKVTTQRIPGGNTAEFYEIEGTRPKSEMIEALHPDVAKVVWRFNRWHHHVDYRPFKRNRLRLKPGVTVPQGINNYGMVLRTIPRNRRRMEK